jgi:excinuclease ABC subunit A
LGNTVLVVEHDDETIRDADWVIDLGPAAGEHGGQVIAEGTPKQILAHAKSLTGQYLSGRKQVQSRRRGATETARVSESSAHPRTILKR